MLVVGRKWTMTAPSMTRVAPIFRADQDIAAGQTSCLVNEACQSPRGKEGRTVFHVQRTQPSHFPGSA